MEDKENKKRKSRKLPNFFANTTTENNTKHNTSANICGKKTKKGSKKFNLNSLVLIRTKNQKQTFLNQQKSNLPKKRKVSFTSKRNNKKRLWDN